MRMNRFLLLAALLVPGGAVGQDVPEPKVPSFLEALAVPGIARGEDEEVLTAWMGILEEAPDSPCSEMILRVILDDPRRYPNYRDLRPILEAARKGGLKSGITASLVAIHLDRIYREEGLDAGAGPLARELGLVKTFLFTGRFGRAGRALHDRAFPPETDIRAATPSIAAEYPTPDGPATWRLLSAARGIGPVDFSPYLRRRAGVVYGVAQVKVEASTPAAIVLASTSSLKVWLNGQEVADLDRGRHWLPELTRIGVTLAPGWNRIGVKLGSRSRPQVFLRVTDPEGFPIRGMEVADEAVLHRLPLPVEEVGEVEAASGAEGIYRAAIESDPGSPGAHLGLGWLLWKAGVHPEAEERLRQAVKLSPDSPHGRSIFAEFLLQANHLPATVRKNLAQEQYKKAIEIDPAFVPARMGLARILSRDGKAEEAIASLRALLETHGGAHSARYLLHQITLQEGWLAEAEAAAEEIEAARPLWGPTWEFRARQYERKGNRAAAAEIRRKVYERDRTRIGAALSVATFEEATGHYEEAIEIYRELVDRRPDDTSLLWSLANAQVGARLYDAAVGTCRGILEVQPWNGRALEKAGHIFRRKGDLEGALSRYRRGLEIDPGLHRLRGLIHHLQGERDAFEIPYDSSVPSLLEAAPGPEAYPKSKVLGVLDLTVLRIYPDGSATEVGHTATKVLTDEGKEQVKTHYPRGEILEIRTITPDGRILEPIRTSGGGAFHLPGLEPGAVVEAKWRRDLRRPFDRFGWGPFYFQDPRFEEPFLLSQFVLIVPKEFPLETLEKHLPFEPKVMESGEERVLIYEAREQRRVEPEIWMPDGDEFLPFLQLYEAGDWADVNDDYRDRFIGRTRPTRALEDAAAVAVEGIQEDLPRARALYDFVNRSIQRDGPASDAHQVLLEKAGDRMILYVGLLEALAIPFDHAFARPPRSFAAEPDWEVINSSHFHAPLLRLRPRGSAPVWLSLESRFYPFGFIPIYLEGGRSSSPPPRAGRSPSSPGGTGRPNPPRGRWRSGWRTGGGCVASSASPTGPRTSMV